MYRLIILLLALIASTTSYAQKMYKWVDDQGVTHYTSSRPPADQEADKVSIRRAPPAQPKSASADNQPSTDEGDQLEEAFKAADLKNKSQQDFDKTVNQEYCRRAQNNLKILNSHGRIRERGKDGEVIILADEQKQERITRAQQSVDRSCK